MVSSYNCEQGKDFSHHYFYFYLIVKDNLDHMIPPEKEILYIKSKTIHLQII